MLNCTICGKRVLHGLAKDKVPPHLLPAPGLWESQEGSWQHGKLSQGTEASTSLLCTATLQYHLGPAMRTWALLECEVMDSATGWPKGLLSATRSSAIPNLCCSESRSGAFKSRPGSLIILLIHFNS